MEAVPVVAVACLVFLLIRTNLLEYYRIPSKSMAPTLHGDRNNGDLVLVDKTAFWFKEPEPFDMVVMRVKEKPAGGVEDSSRASHIVKRMVAVGPVSVTIQEGDLFVGSLEGGIGKRVVKNPVTYADMRVPVFRHPSPEGGETFTDFFRIPPELGGMQDQHVLLRAGSEDLAGLARELDPGEQQRRRKQRLLDVHLPRHMSTHKAIDTSYLDPEGHRQPANQPGYRPGYQSDIGMSLRCVANAAVTGFQVVMEQRGATVAVAYEVIGRGRLLVDGTVAGADFSGPKLEAGKPLEVAFGYLDGHCFLVVKGELVLHRELELPADGSSRRHSPRENGLHFGVAGKGGEMKIPGMVVFHDVHYLEDQSRTLRRGNNEPYIVQEGCMFLLGDNTRDSQDSRDFETDAFRLEDLVGRPIAVLAPPSRSRMLRR